MAFPRLLAGVLAVVALTPSVHALDVTPPEPVAQQPVRLDWPAGTDPVVTVDPVIGDAIRATWGNAGGPHVHGLRLGGNVLHVPFAQAAPTVRAFASDGDAAGDAAFIGTPTRHGDGWLVPMTFHAAGNWTVTVDGSPLPRLVVPEDGHVVHTTVPAKVLVALEAPLVLHPPRANVTVHVALPAHGGGWEPHRGHVTIGVGEGTVEARPTTAGRYNATVPVRALPGAALVWVNVTTPKGVAEAVFTLPRATVPLPEPAPTLTFRGTGSYLVAAHDWRRGLHDAERVDVMPTMVHITPHLPATLVGVHDAVFQLTWPSGHPVVDPGDVNLTRIRPGGAVEEAYPVRVTTNGTLEATVRLPTPGDHVLRLVVPRLGVDETWTFNVGGLPDTGGGDGGDGPPRDTPLPTVAALAALALAAGGRRRWT